MTDAPAAEDIHEHGAWTSTPYNETNAPLAHTQQYTPAQASLTAGLDAAADDEDDYNLARALTVEEDTNKYLVGTPRSLSLRTSPSQDNEKSCDSGEVVRDEDALASTEAGQGALQQPPSVPVRHGYFSKNIKQQRMDAIKQMATSVLLLGTLVMGFLSIYWGSYFHRADYLDRVSFWVIDMSDGTTDSWVASRFTTIANEFAVAAGSMTLEVRNGSDFEYSYEEIYDAVVDEHTWGAFIIAANATTALRSALEDPATNANYSGIYAIEFAYPQGREFALYSLIVPWLTGLSESFARTFAADVIRNVSDDASLSFSDIATAAPQILADPASVYQNNLRPYSNPVLTAVLQVGIIYLIIISFFQFNFFQPVHAKIAPHLKMGQYVAYRLLSSLVTYLLLALFYSLISLAFQVDFSIKFGRAGFVVYWMINYIGMVALGGTLENLALVTIAIYPRVLGFWLIFIVILNVSVSFFSIALQPGIYKFGYAFPVKNICDALKTILLGTKNTMGLNVGIIFCWIALNTALFPFCLWFCGKRMQQQTMKAMATQKKA
ncbi:uncharacterized protein V1518DRAFT_423389 [Limtongia smithiae]|uniref:uncharacterized protein n=1 Tax=Limtongia smithiae TaxID=1125753 RepID=UPI0034CEFE89